MSARSLPTSITFIAVTRAPFSRRRFSREDVKGRIRESRKRSSAGVSGLPETRRPGSKDEEQQSGIAKAILKDELPKLFVTARVEARFDVDEFVERVYRRRNKSSHGGSHLEHEPIIALLEDTLILAAIYLIIECIYLGLDTRDAITKFANAMRYELPLRAAG